MFIYIVYNETRDLNETIIMLTVHWLLAMKGGVIS